VAISILPIMTDDTDALLAWTARELADKIATEDPDNDGFVLRVLAARIAARAEQCSDPLHLLKDASRAVAALAETVTVIIPRSMGDDLEPEQDERYRDTVEHLHEGANGLDDLYRWF
jgi:hypothetical protein